MAKSEKDSRRRLNSTDIDDILDEIDSNEQKQKFKNASSDVDWDLILQQIGDGNINYIKGLITSKEISINQQHPENGRTLLIYSSIIGNYDLCRMICNFGGDVLIKDHDGDNALYYALKYGRYKISELIYYQQLSGSCSNDLREIGEQIRQKTEEAEAMKDFEFSAITVYSHFGGGDSVKLSDGIILYMIEAIKNRKTFGAGMLFYAWYLNALPSHYNDSYNVLDTKLWSTMMETYTEILCDTKDKDGWKWLKECFINSLIWYLPHPVNAKAKEVRFGDEQLQMEDIDDSADDIDKILKKTLFYELLVRVRKESLKQSRLLIRDEIDKIKEENADQWNELISYNINTKYSSNARQDICGCIIPQYNEADLSIYPPSTHFNASKHYDSNIYLNQLMFRANVLDNMFQMDIREITKQISSEIGCGVQYRAGPVKTLSRAQVKTNNEYVDEEYPKSAKILDVNRCTLQFQNIEGMMGFLQVFANKIENKKCKSIVGIIRCKNGWSVYDYYTPQYTDIKLNVLVSSAQDGKIVAEIQFLLNLMTKFKKVAHKLYSIERKFELVYQFGLLKKDMVDFVDNRNLQEIFNHLLKNDGVKYFELLWNWLDVDYKTFIDQNIDKNPFKSPLFNMLVNSNDKIYDYLKQNYNDLCVYTITNYIKQYGKQYKYADMFHQLQFKCSWKNRTYARFMIRFIEKLLDINSKNIKVLIKTLRCTDMTGTSFIAKLLQENDIPEIPQMLINSGIMNDRDKLKIFGAENDAFRHSIRCVSSTSNIMILKYLKNDKRELMKLLCGSEDNWNGLCCEPNDKTVDIMKFILFECGLNYNEIWNLCTQNAGFGSIFYLMIERKRFRKATMVLNYFKNDPHKYLQLLTDGTAFKSILTNICDSFESGSTEIVRCILQNQCVQYDDKWKLFSKSDRYSKTPFHYAMIQNYETVSHLIDYFDAERKLQYKMLQLVKWDSFYKEAFIDGYNNFDQNAMMLILQYCPPEYLTKFLSIAMRSQSNVFCRILTGIDADHCDQYIKSLKWILYSSKIPYKDLIALIFESKDKLIKILSVYRDLRLKKTFLEILEFLKNDRRLLLQFLTLSVDEYSNVFGVICDCNPLEDKSYINEAIDIIMKCQVLSEADKFELFHFNERGCKNAFAFVFRKPKISHIWFLSLFNNHQHIIDLLYTIYEPPQKSDTASQSAIEFTLDIQFITGKTSMYKVFSNETIYNVKLKIQKREYASPEEQRLYYCGKVLQDDRTLSSYGLDEGASIHIVITKDHTMQNEQNAPGEKICGITTKQIEAIFTVINDNNVIKKLINALGLTKVKLIEQIKEYLIFDEKLDITMTEYKTNPFITACKFGKYETIERYIKYRKDISRSDWMRLLMSTDDKGNNALMNMFMVTNYRKVPDEIQLKLLRLLIFNNKHIGYHRKYKLLTTRQSEEMIVSKMSHICYLVTLKYFKANYKYMNDLIMIKDGKCSKIQNEEIIKFVLNSSAINERAKGIALSNVFEFAVHNGLGSFIMKYFENERKILLRFLFPKQEDNTDGDIFYGSNSFKESPFGIMKRIQIDDKAFITKYVFDNNALLHNDKLKVLFTYHNRPKYPRSSLIQCNEKFWYFEAIINYLKQNDPKKLIKLLRMKGDRNELTLSSITEQRSLEMILKYIDALNNENLKRTLYFENGGYNNTCFIFDLFSVQSTKLIFSLMNDDILSELLQTTDEKSKTKFDGMGTRIREHKILMLFKQYMEYLEFRKSILLLNDDGMTMDLRFNESNQYTTNPWITACYLGKKTIIKSVLNNMRNNRDKIESLLLYNCTQDRYQNNCLMVLVENDYNDILLEILNFLNYNDCSDIKLKLLSMKNNILKQTVLMKLCENDENIDVVEIILREIKDKEKILRLLNERDKDNRTCFDCSASKTAKFICSFAF